MLKFSVVEGERENIYSTKPPCLFMQCSRSLLVVAFHRQLHRGKTFKVLFGQPIQRKKGDFWIDFYCVCVSNNTITK